MWKAEYVMPTDVTPAALYRTITDINNWSEWDTGLEYTRLDGDVKPGAAQGPHCMTESHEGIRRRTV